MNDIELARLLTNQCEVCGGKLQTGMCIDHTVAERKAAAADRAEAFERDQAEANAEPYDFDTLRRELQGTAIFADGTRRGELVDLAHFTRRRMARALREADTMLGTLEQALQRIEGLMESVPHAEACKPWRAKNWPDDPAVCVCIKSAYARAITGVPTGA